MRKLLAIVARLMLVLTLWVGVQSSVAYAADVGVCATVVDGTTAGHAPGDSDEVPGDSDKATPHHHGAGHNHDLGVPARAWSAIGDHASAVPSGFASGTPPASIAPRRDLRPPIA
ncbi:hypothetical protein M9980_01075 [Sphingomonas donggukensis]|uniref:Secreted protein n=1 Tax=Sphingomonas donggukensis TaxID=2949093 RepID=A0ABY4TVW4_9SPHN|nr:hypothetical protein [Sphingomonas donggukensis]URW75856.1 hypothetical protein M9980_01075 [Sphingomonas donggukensis]